MKRATQQTSVAFTAALLLAPLAVLSGAEKNDDRAMADMARRVQRLQRYYESSTLPATLCDAVRGRKVTFGAYLRDFEILQAHASFSLRNRFRHDLLTPTWHRARRHEEQCQTAHRRGADPTDQ